MPLERDGNAEPCAVLLLKDSEGTAASAAIANANSSLAEYQRMRTWLVWPDFDFPRTPTGKPRLSVIAARATQILDGRQGACLEGTGTALSGSSSSRGGLDQLLERFSSDGGEGSRGDSRLEQELNLSSLDR